MNTKINWGLFVHTKDYDLKAKNWGHLRTVFSISRYHYPLPGEYLSENKNIFENILELVSRAKILLVYEINQTSKISS